MAKKRITVERELKKIRSNDSANNFEDRRLKIGTSSISSKPVAEQADALCQSMRARYVRVDGCSLSELVDTRCQGQWRRCVRASESELSVSKPMALIVRASG